MPLYIDLHEEIAVASPSDIADAHRADVDVAWKYGIRMRGYAFSPASGRLICVMDAPDVDCIHALHKASHGLIADEIHLVVEDSPTGATSLATPLTTIDP
jgi:Protein of unknown function (DUF4242)